MSRAAQILNELFQSHYPWKLSPGSAGRHGAEYNFKSENGTHYRVNINHYYGSGNDMDHAEVAFSAGLPLPGVQYTYGRLGGHADSQKVFSTVHHILKQHLRNHPELKTIGFTGIGKSRVRLYKHFLDRIAPNRVPGKSEFAGIFQLNREDIAEPL